VWQIGVNVSEETHLYLHSKAHIPTTQVYSATSQ